MIFVSFVIIIMTNFLIENEKGKVYIALFSEFFKPITYTSSKRENKKYIMSL